MKLKTKRNLTYTAIALFNLSTGIGYAIVFPTIWNYIHERFGGTGPMLGLVISAYSISSFFSNPLLGYWADRRPDTKYILSIAICMEIVGSFMYFLGISTWFLVGSRLIAGFGGGGGAAVFADITRTTSESERTSVLAFVVTFRQLGLLVGPALNLFLSKASFHIGQFPVDKYTSPGLFMVFLWALVEVAVLGMYYNLTALKRDEHLEQLFPGYNRESLAPSDIIQSGELESSSSVETGWTVVCEPDVSGRRFDGTIASPPSTLVHSIPPELLNDFKDNPEVQKTDISVITCRNAQFASNSNLLHNHLDEKERLVADHRPSVSDSMIESAERYIQSFETGVNRDNVATIHPHKMNSLESSLDVADVSLQPSSQHSSTSASVAEDMPSISSRARYSGYIRDEVVVLLSLSFISSFSQTVLETVVTPLAQEYYMFTELENSLIYLFAGIEVILVFIAIKFCSRKVPDRVLLLCGIIMMFLAMGVPLLYVPNAKTGDLSTLPYFIITIIIDLIGIAIIVVCSASLLSKVICEENQAFSQGLRRSMISLGCVLGPLWGGAYLNRMYLLFAIPSGVTVLIGILFIGSFMKLKG